MWRRLSTLVRRRVPLHIAEQDLDDEIRFHLETRAEEMVRAGVASSEAMRSARMELGGLTRVKEECRDARFGRLPREIASDLRSAWRQAHRDRGLSVTILATITLAIGVTATVFAVVNAVVLDPLPYRDHERLVMLWDVNPRLGVGVEQARKAGSLTGPDFAQWRDQSGLFDGLAAVALDNAAHLGGASPLTAADADPNAEPATAALVSPSFFEITGVRPRLGRTFAPKEPAVLLQHAYWRRRFQSRHEVVGQKVWQGYGEGPGWSRELLVAGVMPREFAVLTRSVDYLLPFDVDEFAKGRFGDFRIAAAIGRLAAGISLQDARKRADAFSRTLEQRNPQRFKGYRVQLVPVAEDAAGEFRPFLLALLGAVVVLVLVLAVNTATLLLLKVVARAREIAMRGALGASTGRLARQLMTESTCLAVTGAGLGLALAHLLLGWLRLHLPNPKTWGGSFLEAESLRVDATVAVFAVAAALLVGAVFGFLPAWHALRTDLLSALKDSGPGVAGGGGRRRVAFGLIVAQFILAAILATGSGLLLRSAYVLYRQGPGFEHTSRIVIGVHGGLTSVKRMIVASGRTNAEAEQAASSGNELFWLARDQLRRALLDRAASLPGVLGVTSASDIIMSGGYWLASFRTETTAQNAGECTDGLFTSVDANFFSEMRIPLLEGRTFGSGDRRGAPPVAVVSAEVARRCWPGRSAIGQRLQSVRHPEKPWFTVVGIVGDTRSDGMDKPPVAHVYEPWAQNRWWWGPTELVLRSESDPMSLVAPLRRELEASYPDAYLLRLHRLGDLVQDSAWRLNYAAQLSAGLAAVSLLLAAIGIYGVLSHAVRERTREIGLRIALGATARHLGAFIARHAFAAAGVGLLGGLAVSAGVVHSLRALLFGVEPLDAVTFVATGLALAAVAVVAAALPLRRAVKLEPLAALRHE